MTLSLIAEEDEKLLAADPGLIRVDMHVHSVFSHDSANSDIHDHEVMEENQGRPPRL